MRKYFTSDDDRVPHERGSQQREEAYTVEEWEDRAFNWRVKDLCEPCNNEWCGSIEDEAQPILTPLMLGASAVLTSSEQFTLAVWATKTVLMLQHGFAETGDPIPPEEYWWFRHHRHPLHNAQIWVGSYDGSGDWPIACHQYSFGLFDTTKSEMTEEINGYIVVMAVGHLVFRLFGHSVETGTIDPPGEQFASQLRQVWPLNGAEISFPPPSSVEGNAGLLALVESIGDATSFKRP